MAMQWDWEHTALVFPIYNSGLFLVLKSSLQNITPFAFHFPFLYQTVNRKTKQNKTDCLGLTSVQNNML